MSDFVICSCGKKYRTPQALWDHYKREPQESSNVELRGTLAKAIRLLEDVVNPNNGIPFGQTCDEIREFVYQHDGATNDT